MILVRSSRKSGSIPVEPGPEDLRDLAEVTRQVPQVFRTRLDRDISDFLHDRTEVTSAKTRKDHAINALGNQQVAGDPLRRHDAATEIGNTAISARNPARGATSSRTCRSANSARRPVTKR